MTILESLRKRAGFLLAGAASFALALALTRWSAGEPFVKPQTDIGVVLGILLVAVYLVIQDTRTSPETGHASKTGLN